MDAKTLRKQIKNVLKEEAQTFVASEVGDTVQKSLTELMNARLDQIDKYCQQALEREFKKFKAIQTFVIQEVKGKISDDLFNANVTIDAVVAILAEAGLNIPDFAAKIDEKKKFLASEIQRKAGEAMQAEMEKHAAEAAAAKEGAASAAPEQTA